MRRHVDPQTRRAHHANPVYAESRRFYNSKPWLALRQELFTSYGRQCMRCDEFDGRMIVDHITPRHVAPERELDPDNLQILCFNCHMRKTRADRRVYGSVSNPRPPEHDESIQIL